MSEHERPESLLGAYRVLDLTDEKGLLCGKILGDLGADVIKIEKPGGDPARNIGPFYKNIVDPEKSLYWFYTNLNKRSITLNIETDDGRDIFKRLVKTADFLIESFDPGYMKSLGLSYEELERINPRLIMTSITPFGQTGPHSHFKYSDITTWAMTGMMNLCGDADRAPVRTYPQCNFFGGLHGALGSMVAHYFRETTGEGQHVDVSIQQGGMLTLMISAEYWDVMKVNLFRMGGVLPTPRKNLPPLMMPVIYPCKDGYVTLFLMGGVSPVMMVSNKGVVELMDRDGVAEEVKKVDWAKDMDSSTVPQEEYDRALEPVRRWLLTKTKAELFDEAIKRSILLVPVSTAKDLAENAQLRARGYWIEVEHPELNDKITYPGAFVKMSDCQWRIWRRPPLIGEHNEEIYEKELGFTKEQLALLKGRGVI